MEVVKKSVMALVGRMALGLEIGFLFFVALVVAGKSILEWWQVILLFVLAIILIVGIAMGLPRTWAVTAAWIVQIGILALWYVEPIMAIVGLGFVGLWAYAWYKGRQIDRVNNRD